MRRDRQTNQTHQYQVTTVGVRSVALFEGTKGAIVVLAGLGILSAIHHDLHAAAEHVVARLHLNPAKHIALIFVEATTHLDDARLRLLAAGAALYASMRFVEAYGLWRGLRWAQWFAAITGAIYIPFEVFELTRGLSGIKALALIVNVVVVVYLVTVMRPSRRTVGGGGAAPPHADL